VNNLSAKTNKIRSRSKLGCRFGSIHLFLFLACALITARKYNFKGGPENLRTDDRNTNDGAGFSFRETIRERSFTHSLQRLRAMAYRRICPSFEKSYLR